MSSVCVEVQMVFRVNGGSFQLESSAFAISAGRKLAAFDAGNFVRSRVPWVMRHSVNTRMRNFLTRRVEQCAGTSDQFSMAVFRG